jgi:hypothetical protein
MRSAQAVESFLAIHQEYRKLSVSFPIIPDLAVEGACDNILQANIVHYTIHAAGRFKFEDIDNEKIIADNYGT